MLYSMCDIKVFLLIQQRSCKSRLSFFVVLLHLKLDMFTRKNCPLNSEKSFISGNKID